MDFISNSESQVEEMLATLGISSIDQLWKQLPKEYLLQRPQSDDGLSEFEGLQLIEAIAKKNQASEYDSYLGAGCYEHYVPAIVSAICSKSEFLTSYTQYQAEISQGFLQAIFEFQSAVCALTGLDVANASLYDGASSAAEGVLMALRVNKGKNKVFISPHLNPTYKQVIDQYLEGRGIVFVDHLEADVAAFVVQYPNFLGQIELISELFADAKKAGALSIVVANPLVYGLFASARELGADIAVGDMQPFGVSMQFGGPSVGYIAARQELVRELPGRFVGKTVDSHARPGYVLTLQAREQHIRRERATSNICSNQALMSMASLVALLWYGKIGIKELALTNYQRANFLREELSKVATVTQGTIFNEFVVKFKKPWKKFLEYKIIPGYKIDEYSLLVAVTETKSREQLEKYIAIANNL